MDEPREVWVLFEKSPGGVNVLSARIGSPYDEAELQKAFVKKVFVRRYLPAESVREVLEAARDGLATDDLALRLVLNDVTLRLSDTARFAVRAAIRSGSDAIERIEAKLKEQGA